MDSSRLLTLAPEDAEYEEANYEQEDFPMQVSVVGLDISKQVFQLHGVSADRKVALRKRLR